MYSDSYSYNNSNSYEQDDEWMDPPCTGSGCGHDDTPPNDTFVDIEGITIVVATCLSLLGSAATLLTYIVFSDMRNTSLTFAVWLAGASTVYGLMTWLKPFDDDSAACLLVGFVTTYCNLVAVLTTTVVAFGMQQLFSFRHAEVAPSHRVFNIIRKRYLAYVFGVPLAISLMPFTTNSYGKNKNSLSCWIITGQPAGDAWRSIFYTIVVMAVAFTSYVYASVFYKFSDLRERGSESSARIVDAINRIKWYPVILVVVYFIPLTLSILHIANIAIDDRLWSALSISSLKMQGFFNAIAYGMTPLVRCRWYSFLFGPSLATKGGGTGGEDGFELPLARGVHSSSQHTHSSSLPVGHRQRGFSSSSGVTEEGRPSTSSSSIRTSTG